MPYVVMAIWFTISHTVSISALFAFVYLTIFRNVPLFDRKLPLFVRTYSSQRFICTDLSRYQIKPMYVPFEPIFWFLTLSDQGTLINVILL